jgi:hypothetical protein
MLVGSELVDLMVFSGLFYHLLLNVPRYIVCRHKVGIPYTTDLDGCFGETSVKPL